MDELDIDDLVREDQQWMQDEEYLEDEEAMMDCTDAGQLRGGTHPSRLNRPTASASVHQPTPCTALSGLASATQATEGPPLDTQRGEDLLALAAGPLTQTQGGVREVPGPDEELPRLHWHRGEASWDPSGPFSVEITAPDMGDRVYCCALEAEAAALDGAGLGTGMHAALRGAEQRDTLLTKPIDQLMREVEAMHVERILELTRREQQAAEALGAGDTPTDDAREGEGHGQLWVDKHAPKRYTDLLSPESVNREVLAWLRSWDACVFRRPVPDAVLQLGAGAVRHDFHWSEARREATRRRAGDAEAAAWQLGPDKRPRHKIILLCGPPGMGKTTLAHVAAAQCGYRVVEVNASDDRTGSALATRIADAASNRSVTADRRPVCVIVDEVDGVLGGECQGAVAALLSLVRSEGGRQGQGGTMGGDAGVASDSDDEGRAAPTTPARKTPVRGGASPLRGGASPFRDSGSGRRGRMGTGAPRALLRPVICICNDVSAPALRPLKEVARVFHFTRPSVAAVTDRLRDVARSEGVRTDLRALQVLCDKTGADVRACLHTLQFVHRQGRHLTVADVLGMTFGAKDMTKSIFQLWDDLFHTPFADHASAPASGTLSLFHTLQGHGDYGVVAAGCFENVTAVLGGDSAVDRRAGPAAAALSAADALATAAARRGDFGCLQYVPGFLLSFRMHVAGPHRHFLHWPRVDTEAGRRRAANHALVRGWARGVDPTARPSLRGACAVAEVIPAVVWAVAPVIRPVPMDLLTQPERVLLSEAADTLLALGLKFAPDPHPVPNALGQPDDGEDLRGKIRFRPCTPVSLEPPLDTLHCYGGRPPRGREVPPSVRQLLTRAVQDEAIRRAATRGMAGEDGLSPGPKPTTPGTPQTRATPGREGTGGSRGRKRAGQGSTPGTLAWEPSRVVATLEERMASHAPQPKRARVGGATWMDQAREQRRGAEWGGADRGRPGAGGGDRGGTRDTGVRFRHNEGLTNAIRRAVRMRDLLG